MAKLLWIIGLAAITCRMLLGRWPWQTSPAAQLRDIRRARILLGLSDSATRSDIMAAHRTMLIRVHPDHGGSNSQVHAANDARDTLLSALHDNTAEML